MERDEGLKAIANAAKDFNSHAHVERDLVKCCLVDYHRHFNSHAHVERDESVGYGGWDVSISTHTLTWSVT